MRTDRQNDRHDEANSRFSQFCERPQQIFKILIYEISLKSKD
jgi:hypothetical protein